MTDNKKIGDMVQQGDSQECPLCGEDIDIETEDDYQDRFGSGNPIEYYELTITCNKCKKITTVGITIVETWKITDITDDS